MLCVASTIGQLAREMPSAGGLYTYVANGLGSRIGFVVGWMFMLIEPIVAPSSRLDELAIVPSLLRRPLL